MSIGKSFVCISDLDELWIKLKRTLVLIQSWQPQAPISILESRLRQQVCLNICGISIFVWMIEDRTEYIFTNEFFFRA